MTTRQHFGEYLRAQRQAAKVGLGEAARAIGVTTPYYCDVELNRRKPFPVKSETYKKLAALFHVDVDDLMQRALEARNDLKLDSTADHRLPELAAILLRKAEMGTLDFDSVLKAVKGEETA